MSLLEGMRGWGGVPGEWFVLVALTAQEGTRHIGQLLELDL